MSPNTRTELKQQDTHTPAPFHSYWVYTEKGASIHNSRPGTMVNGDPYLVPSEWVSEGLVTFEELE